MKRTRGIALAAAIQAATAVGVVVCLGAGGHSPTSLGTVPLAAAPAPITLPRVRTVPVVKHSTKRKPSATATPSPTPPPLRTLRHPGAPVSLRLDRLGITASVVPVTMDSLGALAVPSDVHQLGWWKVSAKIGSAHGTVVIDGHVDSATQGRGSLFPLRDAVPGDVIVLSTLKGDLRYVVAARRTYSKSELPKETFAKKGQARLVLITCGGKFDWATHHYAANVVVYALPLKS